MTALRFTVAGEPAPQGSKVIAHGKVMRESNAKTLPWRNAVAAAALEAMNGQAPLAVPVHLTCVFAFARPAGHYGTGRNAGTVRRSAPTHPQGRPDLDKLLRAIGDALTGIALVDDSRICRVTAIKVYGRPGATVIVAPIVQP